MVCWEKKEMRGGLIGRGELTVVKPQQLHTAQKQKRGGGRRSANGGLKKRGEGKAPPAKKQTGAGQQAKGRERDVGWCIKVRTCRKVVFGAQRRGGEKVTAPIPGVRAQR